MLPAISIAASTLSWGQAIAEAPAAAKVNPNAEFYEAKPAKEMQDALAKLINEQAKTVGTEIDAKAIMGALGLNDITSYAMSSEKDGTEWKNLMFLDNGGSDKGIFSLIGAKGAEFSAPNMCPAGSDLVLQFDLDLRTAEDLLIKLMDVSNASEEDALGFQDTMKEIVPDLEITNSELLSKINVRFNLAIDLDDQVKMALPMVGELDKPRMVIRLDGLSWIWDSVGPSLIAESAVPFQKIEKDGIITYNLPTEFKNSLFGYSPLIAIDKAKDHIWIASSPEFLERSMSGTNTLASSIAYKGTMKGLPQKGNMMSYLSKDFADLLIRIIGIAEASGLLENVDEMQQIELDKAIEQLKTVNQGAVSNLSRTNNGLFYAARSTQNFEEMIEETQKAFIEALELMQTP